MSAPAIFPIGKEVWVFDTPPTTHEEYVNTTNRQILPGTTYMWCWFVDYDEVLEPHHTLTIGSSEHVFARARFIRGQLGTALSGSYAKPQLTSIDTGGWVEISGNPARQVSRIPPIFHYRYDGNNVQMVDSGVPVSGKGYVTKGVRTTSGYNHLRPSPFYTPGGDKLNAVENDGVRASGVNVFRGSLLEGTGFTPRVFTTTTGGKVAEFDYWWEVEGYHGGREITLLASTLESKITTSLTSVNIPQLVVVLPQTNPAGGIDDPLDMVVPMEMAATQEAIFIAQSETAPVAELLTISARSTTPGKTPLQQLRSGAKPLANALAVAVPTYPVAAYDGVNVQSPVAVGVGRRSPHDDRVGAISTANGYVTVMDHAFGLSLSDEYVTQATSWLVHLDTTYPYDPQGMGWHEVRMDNPMYPCERVCEVDGSPGAYWWRMRVKMTGNYRGPISSLTSPGGVGNYYPGASGLHATYSWVYFKDNDPDFWGFRVLSLDIPTDYDTLYFGKQCYIDAATTNQDPIPVTRHAGLIDDYQPKPWGYGEYHWFRAETDDIPCYYGFSDGGNHFFWVIIPEPLTKDKSVFREGANGQVFPKVYWINQNEMNNYKNKWSRSVRVYYRNPDTLEETTIE